MFNLDVVKKTAGRLIGVSTEHAPEILTACTVCGLVVTVALTAKGAPTVNDILEKEKEYEEDPELDLSDEDIKEARIETAKDILPHVVPPLITGGLTIACAIGSNHISHKRMATLAAAYKVSETALLEYRNKFKQDLLEASKDVTDASNKPKKGKKKAEKEVATNTTPKIDESKEYKMVLVGTGQSFVSTLEKVRAICGDINTRMITEMTMTVNDFADMVGIDHIKHGDKIGWDVQRNRAEVVSKWADFNEETGEFCLKIDLGDGMLYDDRGICRW